MASISLDNQKIILNHYRKCWNTNPVIRKWDKGPVNRLPADFCILEFAPWGERNVWTYATCCMSQPNDASPIELHLFSLVKDENLVELLTTAANYHRSMASLGLAHTVNFGRPWQGSSLCDHGLISLPYLDGPVLEIMDATRFYWLIPITKEEVEYKKKYGVTALEDRFEEGLDYTNPLRKAMV